MLWPLWDNLLQDHVHHKRHRDSCGEMLFNDIEGFIGSLCCVVGQVVALLRANPQVLFQVIPEVVGSVGSSSFDNPVIATTIEFGMIKGDAI